MFVPRVCLSRMYPNIQSEQNILSGLESQIFLFTLADVSPGTFEGLPTLWEKRLREEVAN